MIQLLRVDHRLLHGQVVFSWCGQLNPNCILIANDAAATDDVRKAALRLGKPNNAKLVIKTVDDSIAAINEGKTDKYSLMIVTGNVKDAVRLARETTRSRASIWAAQSLRRTATHCPIRSMYRTKRKSCCTRPLRRALRCSSRQCPVMPRKY